MASPQCGQANGGRTSAGDTSGGWTGDITYLPTDEGWLYLAAVLDWHSRQVVGGSLQPHMQTAPPQIRAGLPSELLRRRPDLAQSLAQLHAATAQVGIAEAVFYPSIKLTGSFGYSSEDLGALISAPARLYSVGPSISLPLFEGGRNNANLASSRAQVEESLAAFRGRMLQALREVDDALAELQGRATVVEAQNRTLASSSQALAVAKSRYDKGAVSYLDVTEAERMPLATERALAQLRGTQWAATAQFVKALGGGWAQPDG